MGQRTKAASKSVIVAISISRLCAAGLKRSRKPKINQRAETKHVRDGDCVKGPDSGSRFTGRKVPAQAIRGSHQAENDHKTRQTEAEEPDGVLEAGLLDRFTVPRLSVATAERGGAASALHYGRRTMLEADLQDLTSIAHEPSSFWIRKSDRPEGRSLQAGGTKCGLHPESGRFS